MSLETTGVVVNAQSGSPVWKGFITPYAAGTGTVDPTGVVEVPLHRAAAAHDHEAQGRLLEEDEEGDRHRRPHGRREAASGCPRPVRRGSLAQPDALKPWAVATTNAAGAFSIVKPLPKKLYVFGYVNAYYTLNCTTGPSTAAKGCVRENTSAEFGPIFLVKPTK